MARFIVFIVVLALLTACHTPTANNATIAPLPSYAEIAKRHNARIDRLTLLNAPGMTVVAEYQTADGKQVMQGDGHLAVMLPDHLMLRVTHIARGKAIFWAGSDEKRYWLFDGRDEDAPVLYFGRHEHFNRETAARLDVPLHPREAIALLGLAKLPEEGEGKVEWARGSFVVTPPNGGFSYWIVPDTGLVEKVEVFGGNSGSWIVAEMDLTEPQRVKLHDAPPGGWPLFPRRIRIQRIDQPGELRLTFPEPDDVGIRDAWFDLNSLMSIFEVPEENVIDLDAALTPAP